MLFEGIEVAIAVQQRIAVFDAAGRDDRVDRLSNGDAASSQDSKVARRFFADGLAAERDGFERVEKGFRLAKVGIVLEPLQHFGDDEVADQKRLGAVSRRRVSARAAPRK